MLNRKISSYPDITTYTTPAFNRETTGFWKRIANDKIGLDKNGNTIHRKTWVNKTLSWIEAENTNQITAFKAHKYKKINDIGHSTDITNKGYIYVMRSAAHQKDVFKIGMTKRSSDKRADELSGKTESPDKFLVVQEWEVIDCNLAEKIIHERLIEYRINPNREFFKAPYQLIFKTIDEVLAEINNDYKTEH